MSEFFALEPAKLQLYAAVQALRACNERTARFGLFLTDAQIQSLVSRRAEALENTGRIEFGEGVLKKLIDVFCDSPYLTRDNYEDTLLELQDSFYYFKNESGDRIPDDELIAFMKSVFDGRGQGSVEYLSGTSLEELCRNTRYGYAVDDTDRYGHPF